MINNNMYIFSALIVIAVLLLMGNLIRLFTCTRRSWGLTQDPMERFKATALFTIYLIITGFFVWCACASLCDIYCPLFDIVK